MSHTAVTMNTKLNVKKQYTKVYSNADKVYTLIRQTFAVAFE